MKKEISKEKAAIFQKRTIKQEKVVTSVDTASEALTVSLSEKAVVDLPYMSELSGKDTKEIVEELRGVIFEDPITGKWETADEYLSGNVRENSKLQYLTQKQNLSLALMCRHLNRYSPKISMPQR